MHALCLFSYIFLWLFKTLYGILTKHYAFVMRFASILIDSVTTVLEDYPWSFSYGCVLWWERGAVAYFYLTCFPTVLPTWLKAGLVLFVLCFLMMAFCGYWKDLGCVFVLFSLNYQLETAHSRLRGRLQLRNYPDQIGLWPCVGNCLYY